MRLSAISFLVGILICQTLSELPDTRWLWSLFPLVLLVRIFPFFLFKSLLFLGLGFFWSVWRADMILTQELASVLERQEIIMVGTIVDLPRYQDKIWRFEFVPSQLIFDKQSQPLPGKIRLFWENERIQLFPGQQWQLTARLKRPVATINPGGTDYSAKLFQQRIRATGTVRKKGQNRLLAETSGINVDLLRYRLSQMIKQKFSESPSVGILIALTIGDGSEISPEQWEIFRRTGTTHLVVISGLQVSAIAFLAFQLASWLWRRLGAVTLWLPTPYFAVAVSLMAAFFYTLLAGFSIPTQRAFIMVAIAVLSVLSGRIAVSHKLALALLLVLIYDPLAVITTGFWLSFGTVAIIIYTVTGYFNSSHNLYSIEVEDDKKHDLKYKLTWNLKQAIINIQRYLQRIKQAVATFIHIQIAITLCLIPVILFIYGNIFPMSFVANFIAIPIISFIIVPMILFGTLIMTLSTSWGDILLGYTLHILDTPDYGLMSILEKLSNTPLNHWTPFIPPFWVMILALIGALVFLLPRGFPNRWLGIIGLLLLFSSPLAKLQHGEIEFTLLDVGQGLASVIRTQNHTLLYDTGPKYGYTDKIKSTILPFFYSKNLDYIHILMISHLENDHAGGSATLLKSIPVGALYTNFPERAEKWGITTIPQRCELGQQWYWDGVEFQVLHPPPHYVANNNDNSCVLKITTGEHEILLSGDIGRPIEYRLIQYYQDDLQADVLVAPHHGSRYSSSEAFIETVKPSHVLFSVGRRNGFNHPHPEIQQRYQKQGAKIFRTDFDGAITLYLSPDGIIEIPPARVTLQRYWHENVYSDND